MSPYDLSPLPNDWLALLAVVYALGLKHGMDPDHLATIDGIARNNAARSPRLARWSGFLFSAGHGAIVILVAIGVSLAARSWQAPQWLDTLGASISIFVLYALGLLNLYGVLATPRGERPFVFTNLKTGQGLDTVIEFIRRQGLMQ